MFLGTVGSAIQGVFTADLEFAGSGVPRHLSQLVDFREITGTALLQYSYDVVPQTGVEDGFVLLRLTDVDDGTVYVTELFESGNLSGRSRVFETISITPALGHFVKTIHVATERGRRGPRIRFDEMQILY